MPASPATPQVTSPAGTPTVEPAQRRFTTPTGSTQTPRSCATSAGERSDGVPVHNERTDLVPALWRNDQGDDCEQDNGEQEALELARRVAASDVGAETLRRLEQIVDELAGKYPVTPPAELLNPVRPQGNTSLALGDRSLAAFDGWSLPAGGRPCLGRPGHRSARELRRNSGYRSGGPGLGKARRDQGHLPGAGRRRAGRFVHGPARPTGTPLPLRPG